MALVALLAVLSVPLPWVAAPLAAILLLHRPGPRERGLAIVLALFAVWLSVGSGDTLLRFTAAWTLFLTGGTVLVLGTRRDANERLVSSGLLAVLVAAGVAMVWMGIGSTSAGELAWSARRGLDQFGSATIERMAAAAAVNGTPASTLGLMESMVRTFVDALGQILPGLLLLESLIALAFAWWFYRALAREPAGAPLPRLKEFRFNDHLIWGVVAALLTLVVPRLDALHALGGNLALFFGMLYLLRGLAILAALFGGIGGLGLVLFLVVVALLMLPVAVIVTLALGVTDTWVDWRRRAAAAKNG